MPLISSLHHRLCIFGKKLHILEKCFLGVMRKLGGGTLEVSFLPPIASSSRHTQYKSMKMARIIALGLQERNIVGGWPAVAVGYGLEGTILFRTCLRFPGRGDWFSDVPNLCPDVSESAHSFRGRKCSNQNEF